MKKIIAISGGIGAGKSVVSRFLEMMGYVVYNCDLHARIICDTSINIRQRIDTTFGPDVICEDGSINRQSLASIVFADNNKLHQLNNIVHGAVIEDLKIFIDNHFGTSKKSIHSTNITHISPSDVVFFETAILFESGLDTICDEIWWIDAPIELRISRVMQRNNISREEVIARISRQIDAPLQSSNIKIIQNTNTEAITPQILSLLTT